MSSVCGSRPRGGGRSRSDQTWAGSLRRPRNGFARCGRGRPQCRLSILVTVLLFGRLQFADLARHPLLAGGELVDIARDPFYACCKFVDVARRLLLGDSNPVNDLSHRVEINRYCIKPLLIGRRAASAATPVVP